MRFSRWMGRAIVAAGLSALALPALAQVVVSDPPPEHHFGKIPVGATYATQYFSITNQGSTPVTLGQVRVDSRDIVVCLALGCPTIAPTEFTLENADGCSGKTLQPEQGCSALVAFVPTSAGSKAARLVFPLENDGSEITRTMAGTGVSQPLECVLDWAERNFPALFYQTTPTQVVSPFVARCYQGGALCVGADVAVPTVAPASIYYLLNGEMGRLGTLSEFAAQATEAPPSTRRCNQATAP